MRHLLSLLDLNSDEIEEIFEIAGSLKQQYENGVREPLLQGRVMGLLFEKPSLRTRVSFEAGMTHLGGTSQFLAMLAECCGTAVEMDCTLHVSFRTLKGEADRRNIRYPIFERDEYFTSPEMAAPRRFIAATGMCIADGVNQSEDGTLASRNALLYMIQLIMARGWYREHA